MKHNALGKSRYLISQINSDSLHRKYSNFKVRILFEISKIKIHAQFVSKLKSKTIPVFEFAVCQCVTKIQYLRLIRFAAPRTDSQRLNRSAQGSWRVIRSSRCRCLQSSISEGNNETKSFENNSENKFVNALRRNNDPRNISTIFITAKDNTLKFQTTKLTQINVENMTPSS